MEVPHTVIDNGLRFDVVRALKSVYGLVEALEHEETLFLQISASENLSPMHVYAASAIDLLSINTNESDDSTADKVPTIDISDLMMNESNLHDTYKCRHCASQDVSVQSVQTRSVDEPATLFLSCKACMKISRLN